VSPSARAPEDKAAGGKPRPLATPREVAGYLRNSPATLKQWRWQGTGPAYIRHGKEVTYEWDDVIAWALAHKHPTADSPAA
jgi:hypothetical protein